MRNEQYSTEELIGVLHQLAEDHHRILACARAGNVNVDSAYDPARIAGMVGERLEDLLEYAPPECA